MNFKTKAVQGRKYSKGWAIWSEECKRTTRRRMSEGLVGQCIMIGEEVEVGILVPEGKSGVWLPQY